MEPKIVSKPAFTVVGMHYRGMNQNQEITKMWEVFGPRIREIPYKVNSRLSYGICLMPGDLAEGEIDYMAGLEVERLEGIPVGMSSCVVPAQQYAAFPCTLTTLGKTYEYALQTWMPNAGYRRAVGPDFEFYGENFSPRHPRYSMMHVYIPIE